MIKKTFITIAIIIGIVLVIGIPNKYSNLIGDEREAFIYIPESDRLLSVKNKISLYEGYKWAYLIPFSALFTEVIYGYHTTDYSTCDLGKLKDLELEEAKKIKEYNSGEYLNFINDFEKEMDETLARTKENMKKKYRYDYGYQSYYYFRGDLSIEELANDKLINAINKIPYNSITIHKNEKDINTNIDIKYLGKPIDLFLLKTKIRHKFKTKLHTEEYELKFYEPEKKLFEEAIFIVQDGKYHDAFNNMNLKSYAGKCNSISEMYSYSD